MVADTMQPKQHREINMFRVVVALVALLAGLEAGAQPYPSKPIRMYVAGAAGDGIDTVSRAIGQKLSETWGQPVVVENRPGAGGGIAAAEATAKAAPDGYTLMMGNAGNLSINPGLIANLSYDPVKDFAPVSLAAVVPNLLVANPGLAANSVAELVLLAKAQPGRIHYASPGNGTGQHLGGELLKSMAGIDLVHVPYKGSGPGVTDLLSGQVQLMVVPLPVVLGHVRAGKLKALAVTSLRRSSVLPAVPTVAEAGLAGYDVSAWYGVVAPAGTPAEVVGRLNAEIMRVLGAAETREQLQKLGAEPAANSSAEFSAYIRSETRKWAKVIRESGAKVD